MKKIKLIKLFSLLVLLSIGACNDYVSNVDPFINQIEDDRLNSESQIDFIITGVQNAHAFAIDDLTMISDGLSDQLVFTKDVKNATFPTLNEIELAEIQTQNSDVSNAYYPLHRARVYADTLIARVGKLTFKNDNLRKKALYYGYLYGGLTRSYSATYFGLTQNQGGDAINKGVFIPSDKLYELAAERIKEALKYAVSALETKIANSLLARIYLFKGDYAQAANYAKSGLVKGDADFEAKYSTNSNNRWRVDAGELRPQLVFAQRLVDYTVKDPLEANRIPMKKADSFKGTYYYQYKYFINASNAISSIPVMGWKENNLMRAELALRGQAGQGDALALVNEVRAIYSIAPLTEITLNTVGKPSIVEERDKQLNCQGMRLPDQRRFNLWHLPGKWQFLPVIEDERIGNPNF